MNFMNLVDGPSALIVVGGTLIATVLRAGLADCACTVGQIGRLGRKTFDADAARAELAQQIQEIRSDGLLRAEPHRLGDAEIDEATDALIGHRSLEAMIAAHDRHKARRTQQTGRAVRTLALGAELAPVFGLAGTLISLSQLPADGAARGAFTGVIAMAVITTLYGLLLANIVLSPLSRAVERKAEREERARQALADWLVSQVSDVCAPRQMQEHLRAVHAVAS